jgi:hypothetical protein
MSTIIRDHVSMTIKDQPHRYSCQEAIGHIEEDGEWLTRVSFAAFLAEEQREEELREFAKVFDRREP